MPAKSKYRIEFKMSIAKPRSLYEQAIHPGIPKSSQDISIICEAALMEDVRKKIKLFKQKCMPWGYDFKLYNNLTGAFIRNL
jgi:hypothetical protein